MDDAAPLPPAPSPEEPPARDWSLLPLDALASVFVRLGAVEVLMGAGLVCRSWLDAANVPDVWRVLDMENHEVVRNKEKVVLRAMAKAAVDRSGGQLRVFAGKEFVDAQLLKYIVESSPSLTTLRLVSNRQFYIKALASVVKESPILELRSLELDDFGLDVQMMAVVLNNCPLLQVLGVRHCYETRFLDEHNVRARFPGIKIRMLECSFKCWCQASDYEIGVPFYPENWGALRPPHGLVYTAINYCKVPFKYCLNKLRRS